MAIDPILGSDTVKDALKEKVNNMFTENYSSISDNEDAASDNADAIAVINAAISVLQSAVAALAAGSGLTVSADDQSVGDAETKLVEGNDIVMETLDPGSNETRSFSFNPSTFFWGLAF